MLPGYSPPIQAALGTIFTWGLTAAGASVALIIHSQNRIILDVSLGFAGGVMLAASYWSLLAPAIEMASSSGTYGDYIVLPVAIGFFMGALFVYGADLIMTNMEIDSPVSFALESKSKPSMPSSPSSYNKAEGLRQRRHRSPSCDSAEEGILEEDIEVTLQQVKVNEHWKRILLLILAITVHNIPEGLAVGVAFGAIGQSPTATFENARNLAIGIGIQNFPEGLAVSLPLKTAGFSASKSIWYGQLSGLVEPIAGVLGALMVGLMTPILPFALAFAAGAMVYVVIDDIIPEAQTCGNGRASSWGAIFGFLVMMSLDVTFS